MKSNEESIKVTPKLRFPEFRESEGWEEKKLGEITGSVKTGKLDANAMVDDGAYRFYTCAKRYFYIDNFSFEGESLLIAGNGEHLGYIHYYNGKFNAYQRTYVLQEFKENVIFLKFYLEQNLPKRINSEKKSGNTPYIVMSTITDAPVFIPSLPEQTRIADCLTSLDSLIAAQTQKLEALRGHKQGLMQQLFPAEGEKTPRLRFKEFEGKGEWEEKTIGETCRVFSGGTPATSKKEYYGGKIPFIRSAEIASDKTELFLTEAGVSNSSAKHVEKGDVLIALYGANSGDVAISRLNGAINQAVLCLKSEENHEFIYQYLYSIQSRVTSTYLQGGQGNLSGEIIKSIKIGFPSQTEQHRIAECLSSLDQLISAQSDKIAELKTFKRGLMQQLFPTPAGAEG